MLHLEEETQLHRQSSSYNSRQGTHILNSQFSECRIWISRKRSFRHRQFLVLKLDNLAISVYEHKGEKRCRKCHMNAEGRFVRW